MKLNIGYFADGPWGHETFNKLINDNIALLANSSNASYF